MLRITFRVVASPSRLGLLMSLDCALRWSQRTGQPLASEPACFRDSGDNMHGVCNPPDKVTIHIIYGVCEWIVRSFCSIRKNPPSFALSKPAYWE